MAAITISSADPPYLPIIPNRLLSTIIEVDPASRLPPCGVIARSRAPPTRPESVSKSRRMRL